MLQETMERLMQDRTVLILAHRLSTVYRADQILVMDGGRLVESGTHAALLEGGQLYRQLVAAYSTP
jgi:ABC-type multidrug transport system fused ATPase/permease subunit